MASHPPDQTGGEGWALQVRGDGRIPYSATFTVNSRARELLPFLSRQPGGRTVPVPGPAAAQVAASRDGHHLVGSVLLTLLSGTLQKI